MAFDIDIDEGKWSKDVLQVLLIDRTTNRNIIWGTDDYEALGNIDNIDEQLFDKYNLSEEEREHIKKSIKDM